MPVHELHIAVANAIDKILSTLVSSKPGFEIKKDEAADDGKGLKQHLSFFLTYDPKRESGVSKVDIIIVKDGVVKLACEIEESGFIPTKIFGKVFSTAAAKVCRLKSGIHTTYNLEENGVFVEVLSSEKMLGRTKKLHNSKKVIQGKLIQEKIQNILSTSTSWLQDYHLLFGEKADFDIGGGCYSKLEEIIKKL